MKTKIVRKRKKILTIVKAIPMMRMIMMRITMSALAMMAINVLVMGIIKPEKPKNSNKHQNGPRVLNQNTQKSVQWAP